MRSVYTYFVADTDAASAYFRFMTLAKAIPFVGGVVGGGVDAALTGVVGTVAKKSFPALG